MILGIIILALFAGIAYFHYAQGFFSATLSAVCAVTAAVIAVGYHEVAVFSLLQGAAADYAHALCLAAIFAGVYIVLRVLFDKAIPGNIRLPVMVDRVGGAAMGVIAAIFTTGIVALAAQMLPFGPSVGGFARYAVEDRPEMNVPAVRAGGRMRNVDILEQMADDDFNPEKRAKLLIPVDDMLLAFVNTLSVGSLAADQPLQEIHPDYPTELFGQRIGIQVGAKRTAANLPGKAPQVTLAEPGLFRVDTDLGGKNAIDSELPELHERPITYTRNPNHLQLVVRLVFDKDASDTGSTMVRVSTGSVRLVADGVNYWPIGTMQDGRLMLNKVDDFIFIDTTANNRGAADFLFVIDEPEKVVSGNIKDPVQTIQDGVFIEAKRLARIDLSGKEVTAGIKPGENLAVQRKPDIFVALRKADAPPMATEVVFQGIQTSNQFFNKVNVGTPDSDVKDATIPSGKVSVTNRQISKLMIEPIESLTILRQGENAIDTLHVPAGKVLVQVGITKGQGDPWAWTALSKWQLIDDKGAAHKPAGAWARISEGNADRMAASYNSTAAAEDITSTTGEAHDITIAFLVPSGSTVQRIVFDKKTVSEPNLAVQ